MARRWFQFVALGLALLGAVACGGSSSSPTSPTPPAPANIAGNWTGTFTFTPVGGGQRLVVATTATFTQASNAVTGQVNITGGSRVTVSGVVDSATLTSTMQYTGAPPNSCAGTASVSGTVSASQIRFTIPSISTSGTCTFFTAGDFVLDR